MVGRCVLNVRHRCRVGHKMCETACLFACTGVGPSGREALSGGTTMPGPAGQHTQILQQDRATN